MIDFIKLIDKILERKIVFLVAFFVIFTFSYGVLFMLDFLPENPNINKVNTVNTVNNQTPNVSEIDFLNLEESTNDKLSTTTSNANISTTNQLSSIAKRDNNSLPIILKIPSLGRKVNILNPSSRTIKDLDNALLSGVVRHPDSAVLGQEGNLFILGHSSYLPKVFNKNFQALNGIQNLKWGDIITLESDDTIYTYQVKKVYQAKAENINVPIAGVGKHLTLATCNSFGSKDDRYIVEADLVGTATI